MKSLQKKFGLTLLLALLIALLISPAALAAEDWGLPEGSPEPIVYTDADKEFSYALLNPQNADVPNDKAVIITVLGDGFTTEDQGKFNYYAQLFANHALEIKPFDEYADCIKIYRINVISNESGVTRDQSTDGENVPGLDPRDTYFNSSLWNGGTQRALRADTDKALELSYSYFPDSWVMLLLNSTVNGGTGGKLSLTTLNDQFIDTCIHELGHTAAGLPDDYFTSTRVFDRCEESYDAYPNLIAKKWIDDPEWQESSMWYRMLGRDGVTFDPFDENPNYFRCHPSCKMRYIGENDYYENYGTEQFPFCEVCKELFRDTLSFASNTNTLHFQPYNDQFYTETPFSFNDWHFIFRSRNGEEAVKVYGEDLPQGDVLTYTVTDAASKVVKDASGKAMQDLTVQDTMTFTTAGTYTVTAQYSGSFGELSCTGEFEVKPATVIAEVGEMTREWQAGTAMALPEIKIDLAAAQAGFVRASDVEIEYAWHYYDPVNEEVGDQIGASGVLGKDEIAGPTSVGDYALVLDSDAASFRNDYRVTNVYPFSITTTYTRDTRYPMNTAVYGGELEANFLRPITIIGEGFTEDEYDEYLALANDFIDKFLATDPISRIPERFDFYIVGTQSRDSGINKPGVTGKETYYGLSLDASGKFGTSRPESEILYKDILGQEIYQRDTYQQTSPYWGATVVLVNEKEIAATDHWRHAEGNRSVHLTTLADPAYQKTIEEMVNQFAYSLIDPDNALLDNAWYGDEAKTEELTQILIKSCFTQTYPVVVSNLQAKELTLVNGAISNLDPAKDFDVYVNGRLVKEHNFTINWYADDDYSVGEKLTAAPAQPGTYWIEAILPAGVLTYADDGTATAEARYPSRGFARVTVK